LSANFCRRCISWWTHITHQKDAHVPQKSKSKKARKKLVRLTTSQVRAVRRRHGKGESTASLAKFFGCHQTTIQNYVAFRTRKDS